MTVELKGTIVKQPIVAPRERRNAFLIQLKELKNGESLLYVFNDIKEASKARLNLQQTVSYYRIRGDALFKQSAYHSVIIPKDGKCELYVWLDREEK